MKGAVEGGADDDAARHEMLRLCVCGWPITKVSDLGASSRLRSFTASSLCRAEFRYQTYFSVVRLAAYGLYTCAGFVYLFPWIFGLVTVCSVHRLVLPSSQDGRHDLPGICRRASLQTKDKAFLGACPSFPGSQRSLAETQTALWARLQIVAIYW